MHSCKVFGAFKSVTDGRIPHPHRFLRTDFGAGCVKLWTRSTEPPWEHRYEN